LAFLVREAFRQKVPENISWPIPMSRPEHERPPQFFYDEREAKKYATSSRMNEIQTKLSERALELLSLPQGSSKMILDVGCGTGLSGQTIEQHGHFWVGFDIAEAMLCVWREKHDSGHADALLRDMGNGLPFKPGSFDGIISISALQWLCNQDSSDAKPIKRINRFFQTMYMCLVRGARAIFQFYPENTQQVELLTSAAMRAGFTGGLLVDYPNSAKAKKYFLVLFAGMLPGQEMPKPVGVEQEVQQDIVQFERERITSRLPKKTRAPIKSKEWILAKKERRKRQGKQTVQDSKYTGRRRPVKV